MKKIVSDINLPAINFKLKTDTGIKGIEIFSELIKSFEKIGKGEPKKSKWFNNRRQELLNLVLSGSKLKHLINTPQDIRVIINLWSTNEDFFYCEPLSKGLLKKFKQFKKALNPSLSFSLIRIFFDKYDFIKDLHFFCQYLKEGLSNIEISRPLSDELRTYCTNKEIIFNISPEKLLNNAKNRNKDLSYIFEELKIPDSRYGRFAQICKKNYYIEPLKKIKFGAYHPVFDEIKNQHVKETPYNKRLNIGQASAILLMDLIEKKELFAPEIWLKLILNILGDPRIPETSPQYKIWWMPLDKKYEKMMRKWLAQIDLVVFLEILEEVARTNDNEKIKRMFPSRKEFLENIYKENMIKDTRLFLGNDALSYVNDKYKSEKKPLFSRLNHKSKSIIYLNIGKAHLIEGTHNFSVRIFDKLPSKCSLNDLESKKFSIKNLSTDIENKYKAEYIINKPFPYIVHHDVHNAWQKKLYNVFSDIGIRITDS